MELVLADLNSDRHVCAVENCDILAEPEVHCCWNHWKIFGQLPPGTMTAEVAD